MTVRLGLPAKLVPTDASDTRMDWRNHVTRNADGTIRTGVTWPVAAGQLLVTATADTGPMTVAIPALDAIAARDNGVVYLCNDGSIKATVTAAPAAGSQRLDVVYMMQHDSSIGVTAPDADNLAGVFVAAGNPTTGTPVKPAIPAAAVELATILVPSGVTATNAGGVVITQTYQYTTMQGGALPFRSKSEIDGWTNPTYGQQVLDLSTLYRYSYVGAWRLSASGKRPFFRYHRTTSFNWTSSIATLPWDAAPVDGALDGFTLAAGVFTCTTPGLWEFDARAGITTGSGTANTRWYRNGAVDLGFGGSQAAGAYISAGGPFRRILAVGDTVNFSIISNATAGGIATDAGTQLTWLTGRYLGPN